MSKSSRMRILITEVESKLYDAQTHEGFDFVLDHYTIHYKVVLPRNILKGELYWDKPLDEGEIEKEIKLRLKELR